MASKPPPNRPPDPEKSARHPTHGPKPPARLDPDELNPDWNPDIADDNSDTSSIASDNDSDNDIDPSPQSAQPTNQPTTQPTDQPTIQTTTQPTTQSTTQSATDHDMDAPPTTPERPKKSTKPAKRPRLNSDELSPTIFRFNQSTTSSSALPPKLQYEPQKSTSSASKASAISYLQQALLLIKKAQQIDPQLSHLVPSLENAIQGKPTTLEQKIDQLLEQSNSNKQSQPLYSDMTKKGLSKTATANAAKNQPTNPKELKLVLKVPDHKKQSLKLDPFGIRNQVNKALRATVVATVSKSGNGNIVLGTTKDYTANYLLERQTAWQDIFQGLEIISAEKPTEWIKLVAHGIPTQPFAEDLNLLKDECSMFNPIKLIQTPRWLTKPEGKQAGSIVFAVATETEKKYCLQEGLIIAGLKTKVVNYKAFSPKTQCYKCQGYGHNPTTCRKPTKCRLCAKNHHTRDHKCNVCDSSELCSHVETKCSNCNGNHMANSTDCEVFRAIRL